MRGRCESPDSKSVGGILDRPRTNGEVSFPQGTFRHTAVHLFIQGVLIADYVVGYFLLALGRQTSEKTVERKRVY